MCSRNKSLTDLCSLESIISHRSCVQPNGEFSMFFGFFYWNCLLNLHFEGFMIIQLIYFFVNSLKSSETFNLNEIDTAAGIPHVVALLLFSSQVSQQSVRINNHAHLDCYSQSVYHNRNKLAYIFIKYLKHVG